MWANPRTSAKTGAWPVFHFCTLKRPRIVGAATIVRAPDARYADTLAIRRFTSISVIRHQARATARQFNAFLVAALPFFGPTTPIQSVIQNRITIVNPHRGLSAPQIPGMRPLK
ncbi:hypothetical protein G3N96_31865 [Burkholderia sp. Se-20373]|uniref:hypothetical protein n=1 Tax=Burkholderia sp. Se-20373 TaxID=2703898 RepID=UPI00198090B8|nr:hypothetical protein [Burkholderia sp. Se-20373]MBN3749986.1 hypothetical protein [Burkholderia sp. Se-20373]